MKLILFFVAAFLCGSFPTAYLVAKRLKGVDIRTKGSGNVGATNAFRVLGKGPGAFVFVIDFLKGALPAYAFARLSAPALDAYPETALLFGVAAILGHVFTPFLGFFLASFGVWLLVFCLTRMVSVSSLLAGTFLLVVCILTHQSHALLAIFTGLLAFILWTHRSNIARLITRSENKF